MTRLIARIATVSDLGWVGAAERTLLCTARMATPKQSPPGWLWTGALARRWNSAQPVGATVRPPIGVCALVVVPHPY